MLTVEQTWECITAAVEPVGPRRVLLSDALGTMLAEDVIASVDSPPFDKSMMDGFAVRSADCSIAQIALTVIDEVTAGRTSTNSVGPGEAIRIMTGAPIPAGADAVVPIEFTESTNDGQHVVLASSHPIRPGSNIAPRGLSMRRGEILLRAGEGIRPQEIALLAETGLAMPLVRWPPRVTVLATGDELVEVDQVPGPGQIRNTNALMMAAQARELGATVHLLGIARDHRPDLAEKIRAGLECDFLCLSGGVSAGKLDLVPSELAAAGVHEIFHKVAMKPGKPVWFGVRPATAQTRACHVFGLPGNPVSSMVCFELFVRTAIRRYLGITPAVPSSFQAKLTKKFAHRSDRPTWYPAKLFTEQGRLQVTPVDWKGSFDLRSTASANCSLVLPVGDFHWPAETKMDVLPWGRTMEHVRREA